MDINQLDIGIIITSAFAIAGLLLVFLPFFAQMIDEPLKDRDTVRHRAWGKCVIWIVPFLVLVSAIDATFGLLTQAKLFDLSLLAFWFLVALIWLVVLLSVLAVLLKRGII
jgi:hypothetical protein